jgi:hypothetical protein
MRLCGLLKRRRVFLESQREETYNLLWRNDHARDKHKLLAFESECLVFAGRVHQVLNNVLEVHV